MARTNPAAARGVMADHPLEIALFNNTGPITFVWLAVRLFLGWEWLQAGWEKLQSADWMNGSVLAGFWTSAVKNASGAHPSVGYSWYADFLNGLVQNGSQGWFAPLVAYGEFLCGIALILGLFTGVTAFFAALMNFNYMMAGSAGVNPLYFLLGILLIMAWKNAGWWGLDRYILPALGTPWHPGEIFRRGKVQDRTIAPEA